MLFLRSPLLLLLCIPGASAFLPTNKYNSYVSRHRTTKLFYEPSTNEERVEPWRALSDTEKWISRALTKLTDQVSGASGGSANPKFSRKTVHYVCEGAEEVIEVASRVFTRLREMRVLGERHVKQQIEESEKEGRHFKPHTLRQTLVVVIPNSCDLDEYATFDNLVETINEARRTAVTFYSSQEEDDDDGVSSWNTSLNLAHLHPNFGEHMMLADENMTKDEKIDPKYLDYMMKRRLARRSPYPTLVIEVKAQPPYEEEATRKSRSKSLNTNNTPNSADVAKLEALFGKSSVEKNTSEEDVFFDNLSNIFEEKNTVTAYTPFDKAHRWVIDNDDDYVKDDATFIECESKYADEVSECVLGNLAVTSSLMGNVKKPLKRTYVVLPNFLKNSATSFEKFTKQLSNIVGAAYLDKFLDFHYFHKEHVDKEKRCPVPVLVIEWNMNKE